MSEMLPPIDSAVIPAGVRAQGSAAVQKYDSALSFEGLLDQQLAQSLTQSLQDTASADDGSDDDSSDDSGGDATTSTMLQMLPQALAQGLVSSGGLGLAPELYTAMGGSLAAPSTGAASTATPATGSSTSTTDGSAS